MYMVNTHKLENWICCAEDYWALGTFLETIINCFDLDICTFTKEKQLRSVLRKFLKPKYIHILIIFSLGTRIFGFFLKKFEMHVFS